MRAGERTAPGRRPGSIEELYDSDRDVLVRLAAFVTGDVGAAVDLVQDAFADLQEAWDGVQAPSGWLRRVVARRSVSWVRRRAVARRYLAGQLREETAVDPPDVAGRLAVRDAVAGLNPHRRAVVFCRFYLDLSEAETAEMLGVPVGTVKSRLSRALREVEVALDD